MSIHPSMICRCFRCGAEWVRRTVGTPRLCAKCKTPYWNVEKGKLPMGRRPNAKKKKAAKIA